MTHEATSPEPIAHPSSRLVSLDVMRAIAVLMVMVSHLPYSIGVDDAGQRISATSDGLNHALEYGRYGVHLFLVISGFCIHLQWARARQPDARIDFGKFWRKRLTRLYPPYFVALVGSLALLWVYYRFVAGAAGPGIAGQFGYTQPSLFVIDLFLLLFLFQNVNGSSERVGNGPFWSLALEEQLYLLYFPLLWVRRKWGWGVTLAGSTAICLGWRAVGLVWHDSIPASWSLLGPSLWTIWVLGALGVEAHFGWLKLPTWMRSLWAGVLLLAAGFGLDQAMESSVGFVAALLREPVIGMGFFVLVNAVCSLESAGRFPVKAVWVRPLAWLGTISYAVYLVHQPLFVAIKTVLVRFGANVPMVWCARMLFAIAAAWVFYVLFEKPAIRWAAGIKALRKS